MATLRDLQARKRKAISTTRTAKRRRLELKSCRYHYNKTQEVREGTSYSSGIAASCVTEQQIDQIPVPNPPPVNTTVTIAKDYEPVFFDLETTGLGRRSHITQIAAVCGKDRWCTYVTPRKPISPNASKITNLSCSNGQLYLNGKPVQSLPISQALDQFIFFCSNQIKPLVLAGHNIRIFDCPVLLNALKCNNKSLFDDVAGFLDTKTLFNVAFPGLESYSQSYLFKHITGSEYDAHDALQDVLSLQKLCYDSQVDLSQKKFECTTFSTCFIINSYEYSFIVEKNLPSLKILVSNKVFSLNIARKAAGSGLNLQLIKLAYDRDGVDGVRCVFVENCGKGVRVTKSSKIINSVCEFFSKSTKGK